MRYAIIPTANLIHLQEHYKVINQIWKEEILLPFLMLEDYFTAEKITEIEANEGLIFDTPEDYFTWLEQQ
ncbi:MAG: hypothetical protein EOP00_11095 [Pedobacter sp.]|nr:MAG: hypothetical protein EOP00_11095 [Pedobacter sp.]